jgi:hypothetical protein
MTDEGRPKEIIRGRIIHLHRKAVPKGIEMLRLARKLEPILVEWRKAVRKNLEPYKDPGPQPATRVWRGNYLIESTKPDERRPTQWRVRLNTETTELGLFDLFYEALDFTLKLYRS